MPSSFSCKAVAFALLLLYASIQTAPAQQTGRSDKWQPPIIQNLTPFDRYGQNYRASIKSVVVASITSRRHMLFSSVQIPAAGMLLRRSEDGIQNTCSGVLISAKHFLTAAHCVCERIGRFWRSYEECAQSGAPTQHETFVFLPAAGLFQTSGAPLISQEYGSFEDPNEAPDGATLGDLAIIELSTNARVRPLEISSDQEEFASALAIGFGTMSLRKRKGKADTIPPGVYAGGIGTVSFPDLSPCYKGYGDVVCGRYVPLDPVPNDEVNGTAACSGDSGGPLIGLTKELKPFLIGITSHRIALEKECFADAHATSFYTRVESYKQWIDEVVGSSEEDGGSDPECVEGLVNAQITPEIKITIRPGGFNTLSVSGTAPNKQPAPAIHVIEDEQACAHVLEQPHTVTCLLTKGPSATIQLQGPGIVQISSCFSRASGE